MLHSIKLWPKSSRSTALLISVHLRLKTIYIVDIFNVPDEAKDLKLKLASFLDGGNHFVLAMYCLEGDGRAPCSVSCYERLATVSNPVAIAT